MLPVDLYEETERVPVWSEVEWDASVHAYILPDGQEMIFFHFDCYLMTPRVLKHMKASWETFRKANPVMLFTMQTDETPANGRLVKMFGFTPLSRLPCTDGKMRTLYVNYGPTASGGPKEQ